MFFGSSLNLASTRIPSDRRKWPAKAEVRTHLGREWLWCSVENGGRHLEASFLEPYRQIGDPPVDEILRLLDEEGRGVKAGEDVLQIAEEAYARQHHQSLPSPSNSNTNPSSKADDMLVDFYRHYQTVPAWVDWTEVQAGQQVLLAYLPAIAYSLYYRSLVPGFSIPKIAAVLTATAYLAPPSSEKRVSQRLMDTGAFLALLCATKTAGDGAPSDDDDNGTKSLRPGGEAWKAALYVRFLHAKVRSALLKRKGERQWKTSELGVPINQEDMAATLLAFATNALQGTEYIMGWPLPESERRAYTHFWRYVGWLLGVETEDDIDTRTSSSSTITLDSPSHQLRPLDPCGPGWISKQPDSMAHSEDIFASIILHILSPDKSSVAIAHHLLRIGRRDDESPEEKGKTDKKHKTSTESHVFYFRALQCRRFVGDPLADALELPFHPVWHRRIWQFVKSTLILYILRIYTIAALPWSPFRGRIVKYHYSNMDKFAQYWRGSHTETMTNELAKQGSIQGAGGACPFAMVAPPRD
jgi:hypothetical protein